jgi:hypothetical protein
MNKPTITRIWLIGLVGLLVGLCIGGVALGLTLAYGGHFVPKGGNQYDFIPTLDAFFWTTVGVMSVGLTVAMAGAVAQLAAWIGALVNAYQIEEKTWFLVLLAGGLLGLGLGGLTHLAVMVAYLVAGPDSMALPQPERPTPPGALSAPVVGA